MQKVLPVLALVLALPVAAAPPAKTIALERKKGAKPEAVPEAVRAAVSGQTISLEVVDGRGLTDPQVVGSQVVEGQTLYEWRFPDPFGPVLTRLVEEKLNAWNVTIDQHSARRLQLWVTRFHVDEVPETFGSSYKAEVLARGVLRDEADVTTPVHRVKGTAKRSGPDQRAKLCSEALIAALDDALAQVLSPPKETAKSPTFTIHEGDPDAVTPKAMLKELVRLKDAGVGESVLVGYVRQRKLAAPLTADEILQWKASGLPEPVIEAAQQAKAP